MISERLYWTLQGALSLTSLVIICCIVVLIMRLRRLLSQQRRDELQDGDDSQTNRQIQNQFGNPQHLALNGEIRFRLLGRFFLSFFRFVGKDAQQ